MSSASGFEKTIQKSIVEMRLSWSISTAWQILLENTLVTDEYFMKSQFHLSEQAREILPPAIVRAISQFIHNPIQSALILRNCLLDRTLPPTPYGGQLSSVQTPVSYQVNLALYQLIGVQPVVYEGENDGNLFRHVVPSRLATQTRSSHGSRIRFGYHVDNPDLPLLEEPVGSLSACPEYLSLFGMRCDSRVTTTLVLIDQVLERLNEDVVNALAQPKFTIRRPASFGVPRETHGLPLIVAGKAGKWLCRFDTENTFAVDSESVAAIKALRAVLEKRDLDIALLLLPGDFLIFKNQRTLHARDAFVPLDDGVDRWMLRLFGMSDLSRTRPALSGRSFEVA